MFAAACVLSDRDVARHISFATKPSIISMVSLRNGFNKSRVVAGARAALAMARLYL